MVENKIQVVIKCPGENAEIKTIDNDLRTLQKIVGGYIETVTYDDCVVICNEDGIMLGMDLNTKFRGVPYLGDIIVAATSGEKFASLQKQEACKIAVELDKGDALV